MATSLASQLAQIAAKSRSSLNIKAQKAAHSKSLIFEPRIAAAQSYQTVYSACRDGFDELCRLDARFLPFATTLFSEQSQDEDRIQMTATENAELDKLIESFLRLAGSRLRLMPAIKAVEWLVRRFRIHEENTSILLSTFLPYHTIPAFVTLLSILPSDVPTHFRFLMPYIRSLTAPPRAAIVYQATHHPEFLMAITTYTLDCCRAQQHYAALISFWGGIMTEAVNGRIDMGRSGRRGVQLDKDLALLQLVGPPLGEALVLRKAPGAQIAAYMVVGIVAAKGNFEDKALSAFMEQLVMGWTTETLRPGLVCLSILAQYRSAKQVSGKVAKAMLKIDDLPRLLLEVSKECRVDKLANGLALALIDRLFKKGDARGLPVIKSILLSGMLQEKQAVVTFKALLVAAHKITDDVDAQGATRKQLGATLVGLSQSTGTAGTTVRKVIEEVDFDIEDLELKLDTSFGPRKLLEATAEDVPMDDTKTTAQEPPEGLEDAMKRLAMLPRSVSSFLSRSSDQLFEELCKVLLSVASSPEELLKFDKSSFLGRQSANDDSFYFSFCMRVWCGPYPTMLRTATLEMTKKRLKEGDCADVDFQAMIPYCISALNDPAKKVRRAAADLLTVLGSLHPGPSQAGKDADASKKARWAGSRLYEERDDLKWLSPQATGLMLHVAILPALEEAILHEEHISHVLESQLESSSRGSKGALADEDHKSRLSSSIRSSILTFLSSHVVYSPLLTVKARLLKSLNQIRGPSGASRTQLLLPLLLWWASLPPKEATQLCARELLEEASFDASCVDVVLPNDKQGLDCLCGIISNPKHQIRGSLIEAAFSRLRKMWPSMKGEAKFTLAQTMLGLTSSPSLAQRGQELVAEEASEFLRSVDLTTNILISFLESLQDIPKITVDSPANKRRRTSSSEHSRGVAVQATGELKAALNKVTFVLQLVEGSKPAEHPELLQSLFMTLGDLQVLRSLVGSELGYLQNLVLSSLLAMVPTYKNNKSLKIDTSVGHGDVLVQCIQKSSSPAVQNSALLLVASLANTAPDVVLHSVMPIFTFMGGSVLRQGDDYSAHVVTQTIKEVVPPLIETFRKGRRNLVASASELLSSFVIAYEHIPSHRKHEIFISLIENLGPQDFLFAIVAMLVDKYGTADSILAFSSDMMDSFGVDVQLHSLVMLVDLISDIFEPKPTLSAALLSKHGDGEQNPQKSVLKELTLLPKLLSSRQLRAKVGKLAERDDMEASRIRDLYASLLERILTLAETVKDTKSFHARCSAALANLLNLLSIGEFIKAAENLLDRPSVSLRQKVLRALEVRVDQESNTAPNSRAVLLAFLPQLTAVIRDSEDIYYKHTAVACVDKISEKYGKKDIEAVAAAASTIASGWCLGQDDKRLRVMALLCLASLVDVLQDAIVPVLPVALPKALSYLSGCLADGSTGTELHNAVLSFVSSLAQHLPYMMTESYLGQLLASSNLSAEAALDDEANQSRKNCLQFLAEQVDAKIMLAAMEKNWELAVAAGFSAVGEYLTLLGTILDKHPKSVITKNITSLCTIFISALDLRRVVQTRETVNVSALARLAEVDQLINEVALKMIYKLNDAMFRPVFTQLMEWLTTGLPKSDVLGRTLRHQSVYSFLLAFFDDLKSIVTGYASYMLEDAADVLKNADPAGDMEERELWKLVLKTLTKCFEHDQDDFWQAPAHFEAIAPLLVAQLSHAAALDLFYPTSSSSSDGKHARGDRGEDGGDEDSAAAAMADEGDVVPTIVELAAAADSQEHQRELNTAVLKHLRSERAAVRLAAVRCQQGLTGRLGEDWLSMLPEMLPYISELQDDDDEAVERETHRWIGKIEAVLGESLDSMLQ